VNLLSICGGLKMERKPLIPAGGRLSIASFEGRLGTAKIARGERYAAGLVSGQGGGGHDQVVTGPRHSGLLLADCAPQCAR
jgi:hypothetical protein